MNYPGGKGGCFRQIINLIPPHRVYIEPFLGGGNVLERKFPAAVNIGVDIDPEVIRAWRRHPLFLTRTAGFICGDATTFLKKYTFRGDEFIYADPPYLLATRKGGRLYRHEFTTDQHAELLAVIKTIPAAVMISGYPSELYNRSLTGWHTRDFKVSTRRGPVSERVWMNYPPPKVLHEYTFYGSNFRERERIKRKRQRWETRIAAMDEGERHIILEAISGEWHPGATRRR